MKIYKTKDELTFLQWFPEIRDMIFKHFRILSITVVVENLEFPGAATKFEYKKEK